MKVFDTKSADETLSFAQKIGETCKPGTVIGLTGDLGTGKTVFAKGFAAGLGIKRGVNSPTYTIVHQYDDGRLPFYHFDVYRIGDVTEMEETGFDDCVLGEGVTLVEWADIIREIMPTGTIWINIAKDPAKGFDYRRIMVEDEYTGD
jgi:tRNA threonylcarbamoyladenosine biosynthesis protein TsaE